MTVLATRPEGYSITVCSCEVPYVGARKAGTVDRCEVCGFITPEQFDAIYNAIAAPAWSNGFALGEHHERSLWKWSAGGISRAVNGLRERPVRPKNPFLKDDNV